MVIHFMEAYIELVASPETARDMSAAVALAYTRYPHTFIVGLLSLMLSMQLIGMAMLSLQNKKYFDELFHLGSTLLRERREADLRRRDKVEPRKSSRPGRPATGRRTLGPHGCALSHHRLCGLPWLESRRPHARGRARGGRRRQPLDGPARQPRGIPRRQAPALRAGRRDRSCRACRSRRAVRGGGASRRFQDPALRQGYRHAQDQLPGHGERARARAPPRLQARLASTRTSTAAPAAALQRGRQRPRHRQLEVAALGLRRLEAVRRALALAYQDAYGFRSRSCASSAPTARNSRSAGGAARHPCSSTAC
jgi:hypothetical protein